MDETYDVVVVGAGLAGLTAAATAADGPGCSVLVLDGQAAGRGGRAATDQVGRFRFNRGAHALYRTTPGRSVLKRLGVEVVAVHPPPTNGGLGRLGDRLGLLPTSAGALARTDLFGVLFR
jgi:phytoene dehydrogenase-like protein